MSFQYMSIANHCKVRLKRFFWQKKTSKHKCTYPQVHISHIHWSLSAAVGFFGFLSSAGFGCLRGPALSLVVVIRSVVISLRSFNVFTVRSTTSIDSFYMLDPRVRSTCIKIMRHRMRTQKISNNNSDTKQNKIKIHQLSNLDKEKHKKEETRNELNAVNNGVYVRAT